MRTLRPTQAWILILCFMTVVSSGATEHATLQHDVSQHGNSTAQKTPQNIVPFGIQIPEHVLSTQNVACISADDNIFQIMNEAQKACNGSDMRCTFYHFVNHGYENIGTVDVNKELFDELLMKFDNWLLTAENINKSDVHGKVKEGSSVGTASINANDKYRNEGKVDHKISESDDDRIHGHHTKNPDEIHHKNHHHWKNDNHIKLDTEYNNEHRYFEVFLPKDKETGKPRTIYVEIDRDKNEFVLLDEDIDKKLNGIKPIKIELDELCEIADTAFSDIVKSSNHKGCIDNNLEEDDRVMTSDLNTNSAMDDHEIHSGIDSDELSQNILNPNPNICNIIANQQLICNNTTGNVKKVLNVSKGLVVPNKYLNQAQFHVESQINNTVNMMPSNNLEILQNTNETDKHDPDIFKKGLFDTIEFDHSNITELNTNNDENSSLEFTEIPCEDENSNCTENNEISIDHENIHYDDNDFIQLVENNDTNNDINFDDTHDFASKDLILKDKENELKSTPDIYVKPKSSHKDPDTHSIVPGISISPYTTIPLLGKDLAKVVETDSNLQSSFPVYATFNLPTSDFQNSPEHPTVTCHDSGRQTTGSKIPQLISPKLPSPPVECFVGLNKGSKYSFLPSPPPFNLDSSWPPSYSTIKELQMPCAEKSLDNTSSPRHSILPITQTSKEFPGSLDSTSLDHTMVVEDPRLLQNAPSLSFDVQKSCSTTSPFHLEANTATSPKHVLPTKVDLPSTTSLSVMPYSPIEVVNSPYPIQPLPPYLQPTGFSNSPFDNNFKDTMIPCPGIKNRNLCNTMPFFLNPYTKPPQLIPPYFDPQLSDTPSQSTSKIPTYDSPPISLDQNSPYLNSAYPRDMKSIPLFPLAPNIPFSPSNPPWLESGFIPNTCPSVWNHIPYQPMPSLPYYSIPAQNMWNYPPTLNNYLAPTVEIQQSQFLKKSPTKEGGKSVLEDSYPTKNILQMTPSTYATLSSAYPRPVQMDLNPSFSLERDLQTLSCKYGIPLSKILDSLEAEIFDTHSKSCSSPSELPCSILEHGSSIKSKSSSSSAINSAVNDENRNGNKEILLESDLSTLTPLDSGLIGPHLNIDNASLLDSNDYQTYSVAAETTGPLNAHLSLKNQPKQIFQDSSLIGPHLSTLSTSNFQLSDEERIGNAELHLESDSSSLMPLDSSLIGPHLEIRPSIVLDSNISQGSIATSYTAVPGTSSSQIKTKHNIQNQPTILSLDSSLEGPHLATLSEAKPLLSGEIQSINDMILLESDLTELTPVDTSQVDLVNELEQSGGLQHEKTAVTLSAHTDSTKLFKPVEIKPNLTEEEFSLLDSSLIGPHLQTGSSIINTSSVKQKTGPEITQDTLETANELESIILPPSMLPTLLKKTVTADLNLNVNTQDAQLNEVNEHNEMLSGTNVELPITDTSSATPFLKETDFQILEPTLVQPKIVKHKLTSPEIKQTVDSDMQLDRSFFKDPIPLHKIQTQEMSSNLDFSIQLDNSLIGPSLLKEIDSREMSPMLDSIDHHKSSIEATFANQKQKPLTVSAAIDSEFELDSSLTGPTLFKEIKSHESPFSSDFVTQLDNSLLVPNLHETIGSSAMSSVSVTNSQLQASTKGQNLKSEMETIDESRSFDAKHILDSSLIGPRLSTAPFSIDEIKIINKELQLESALSHSKPLDSSLIGPHLDFEGIDESEISRYQNPEPSGFVEGESSLELNSVPTVCPSDQQELLSKFTNAITKSHLSPSEMKPCDKLLSSMGKIISSDSKNIPFDDLVKTFIQLSSQDEVESEFSPIPLTVLEQNFLPVESNYFPTPVTFPQYAFAKEVPRIPITPYSPFVQMKPIIDRNWLGPPLNIQNILQGSAGLLPVTENCPIPFIPNALSPLSSEDYNFLLALATQNHQYPQLFKTNICRPVEAIAPSSDWTIPTQILPADKYIPSLPKKPFIIIPSDLESTVCNAEYNPVVIDDIMSLINENSHQILEDMPYSQSFVPHTVSEFERGDILSPSLLNFVKMRPVLPNSLTNAIIPSSLYNPHMAMNDPQNIQTPYMPPYNLQSYCNVLDEAQLSEMNGPVPKLISSPTQFPYALMESQLPDISNTPQFIQSVANTLIDKEYLQQLLSKPCLDSPIVLPSSALKAMLKLHTASNELTNVPCQPTPVYFPPISPIYSTSLPNAFTSPLSPSYASPLSVSYAKAISSPNTSLPLDLSFAASPITSPTLSINPYTTNPSIPKFSSPRMPVGTEFSDFTYLPTVAQNRLTPSADPCKQSHTYSSPYLLVQPSPIPIDTSPYPSSMSKLTPAMTSLYLPAYSHPRPAPKSLDDLGLPAYSDPLTPVSASPIAPTQTGILSPSYLSPVPSFSYIPLPDTSTQKRPSNVLSPAYVTPITQESPYFPMNTRYVPSNAISSPISQITNQESQLLRPLSTLPLSCVNNLFSNANEMLPTGPYHPIPSYSTLVPKLTQFSKSQIKQNKPCGEVIQSNLQTSPLTEEEPFYNVIEENRYTHSNVRDKYFQEPSFNYPFESMSYTLAPEEMAETLPDEDLIKPEDLVISAPISSLAAVPSLQAKLSQKPCLTPYTSPYGKPCSSQLFSHPLSLTELIQQNIFDNISLIPSSNPLKHPASQPILSSPLLKPLTPFSLSPNLPILPYPCMDTSVNSNYMLPLNKEPLLSSPSYSITNPSIAAPPIDPSFLKDITSPAFFQVPTNIPFTPITSPKSQTSSFIPNILLSSHDYPKSSSIPNCNQYAVPIMSHFSGLEESMTPQCITPLSPAQNFKKIKPILTSQCMSSILPAPITFQDSIPLYETPILKQPFITTPTGLVSSAKNMFLSPSVTSPYTESSTFNKVVEPLTTDLINPQWLSVTPQHSLPIPVSSTTVPFSTLSPKTAKQALTNYIIPSSLFTIPDTNLLTTSSLNKLSCLNKISKYSLPSPTFVEPLQTVPYESLNSPLGNAVLPQKKLKPSRQFTSNQFNVPQSSLPYLTQPQQPIDSYPAQPTNDQYNGKPHPKLSPVSTQYATSCFTPLPLETIPNRVVSKPQYGLPSVPICDTPIYTSFSGRNPFLNPNFKPIPEVPSYPVPNNLISSPKITPFDSILLQNLRPVDTYPNHFQSYTQITSLPPLHSLSLPSAKPLPQKSRVYEPGNNPINSQYVSLIESIPQSLPSTSPLLKPLLTNYQNIEPCLPMHLSRLNTASPEITTTNYLPSVTGTYQYPGSSTSLLSETPETAESINILPTPHCSLFKPRLNKLQQKPLTMANMPSPNYEIVEPSPKLSMNANILNIAKPIEVSALHSSLLSRDSFDPEIIEEIEPAPDSKYTLSPLSINLSQQKQFYPGYTSIPKPSSKYKTSDPRPPFSLPTLIPEAVELIDTTDFIPLSQIKSEPLIADYSSIDRDASIIKNTPTTKPDISQFSPYTTLLNTEATSPTYMKLPPKLQTQSYSNQMRLPSLFLSPQEYKELIQGPSISDGSSSSSSNFITSTNTEPQIVSSQLTGGPRPVTLYTSPIPSKPGSWLQSPTLEKYFPPHEIPIEVIPEKQGIEETLLNKYGLFNKIAPLKFNRYPNEPKSSIPEVSLKQNIKFGSNTEYEDQFSDDFNEYDSENMPYDHELENITADENRFGSIEAKSLTETLPEIVGGLNIPSYNEMAQRPQKIFKLDHFFENNHIGQSPQVFTVPTYKTLHNNVENPSTTISPELLKEFNNIATKHFSAISKLDTTPQTKPNEYFPENENSPKYVPITNVHPQTHIPLKPDLKTYSQRKFPPNAIEIADISEIPYQPTSYTPNYNINDIKYSGYKTYQIPSLKYPKATKNLGTPTHINDPTVLTYSPPILASKASEIKKNPSNSHFYTPTEIYELQNTQSQTLVDMTSPLQTKLELKTSLDSLEYDEYNPIEDIPASVDNINEDNELKTSLINYINNRGDVVNNLDNNKVELTIPIGNIAITKKEPHKADTIETSNPSIGLKVWKSNVKIAQAELKLKFKDLSVNNFMPVVNNLDKYDMEEIRKIVKNYIDEKYGAHIEVNEPYTVDNKYSIIKDFDFNAVENKYNLLWPTHYI